MKRFWSKVDKSGDCWEWTAYKDRYGCFGVGQKVLRAHRVAWELENGPVPEGVCVLHRCDNPGCVRPSHLFLGTQQDNMNDMYAKGRGSPNGARPGGAHHNAKLTSDLVYWMRASRLPHRVISDWTGVSESTVSRARSGITWRHILPEQEKAK